MIIFVYKVAHPDLSSGSQGQLVQNYDKTRSLLGRGLQLLTARSPFFSLQQLCPILSWIRPPQVNWKRGPQPQEHVLPACLEPNPSVFPACRWVRPAVASKRGVLPSVAADTEEAGGMTPTCLGFVFRIWSRPSLAVVFTFDRVSEHVEGMLARNARPPPRLPESGGWELGASICTPSTSSVCQADAPGTRLWESLVCGLGFRMIWGQFSTADLNLGFWTIWN